SATMITHRYFCIAILLKAFSKPISASTFWLFRFEDRVTLHVHPVARLSRNMAPKTIFFVIGGDLLIGRIRVEERPSPSIAPKWVVGVPILFVFDHDEPYFGLGGPMCVTCGHRAMISAKYLFHQNRSVSKLAILPVVLCGARRCIRDVHLLSLR